MRRPGFVIGAAVMKKSRSVWPSTMRRPFKPVLATNTPCGRLRPASSRPKPTGPFWSCRTIRTRAWIVSPGRMANSSGPASGRPVPSAARISAVTFAAGAIASVPRSPSGFVTSAPARSALAVTVTALLAASSGAVASAAAESTPNACFWPASITSGPWNVNPAGRLATSIVTGPSKPSSRSTVNVSSRPLPGLTLGSRPPIETVNDGCGGRMVSAYRYAAASLVAPKPRTSVTRTT